MEREGLLQRRERAVREGRIVEEMATHTPGPWKWLNYPDGRKLLCAMDCAVIHCPDAPMSVEPADAHLIAAAPDLLAFARKIAAIGLCSDEAEKGRCYQGSGPYCGTHGDLILDDEIAEARALVTKAEGR